MPICAECGLATTLRDPDKLCWGCRVRRGEPALSRQPSRWSGLTAGKVLLLLVLLLEGVFYLAKFWGWVGDQLSGR